VLSAEKMKRLLSSRAHLNPDAIIAGKLMRYLRS
jgi:hypothetical protein